MAFYPSLSHNQFRQLAAVHSYCVGISFLYLFPGRMLPRCTASNNDQKGPRIHVNFSNLKVFAMPSLFAVDLKYLRVHDNLSVRDVYILLQNIYACFSP